MEILNDERQQTNSAIRFLVRNYKPLLLFPVGAAIIAVIVTCFIPKKYKAFGIVFPTAFNSITKNLENPTFGYDIEADRLMQTLQSREITDSVVKKFDLLNYYDISKSDSNWTYQLMKNYRRDIEFERSPYMSVFISAETKDPELSADIVNTIIELTDKVREKIIKTNVRKAYESLSEEYRRKKLEIDTLAAQISKLRDVSHSNYPSLVNGQMIVSGPSGNFINNTELEMLVNRFHFEHKQLDLTGEKMELARQQLEQPIPGIYVIDRAVPVYHKTTPSYSKNALVVWLGTLLFTIMAILVRSEWKQYRASAKK